MKIANQSFQFGDYVATLETGKIARQAHSAIVTVGDTVVMANCVARREAFPEQSFFPLTVNYQERTYAAGKIPGGFFKREGRPNEKEILTSRLIDRPLRPLFPKGFRNEVQIIVTVLSLDPEINADIPGLIAASAAVSLSGTPFSGPVGAARVGYLNEQYVVNPSAKQMADSALDLVVAGTQSSVLMVESEAQQLSEDVMLGAVMFGHEQFQGAIQAIRDLTEEFGVAPWERQSEAENEDLRNEVASHTTDLLHEAYEIVDKLSRKERIDAIHSEVVEALTIGDKARWSATEVDNEIEKLESHIVRSGILAGESRIDGRDPQTIRPITAEVGILPRAHGSALFTRGETQALVVATLGTDRDSQIIDAIEGMYREPFMLHYNFPPYCVGETGRFGIPKRREIGHGRLAKRGILGVMPDMSDYPYTIRVVSEITESNGSSSMASVCGTSLALMDAGVAIESSVAGDRDGSYQRGR